jgi:glycosyltransferase involved in cell wall biosynthesis
VGRLVADKGAHTALEALAVLVNQYGLTNLRLTMVGSGEPDYEARLSQLVQEHQLEHYVTFLGAQPVETLPTLYRQADIFLFTSIWPEPFGRVVVEAMASGAAVVGAATGGAAEMMQPGHNALTFAPADAGALAAHVVRLLQTPSLRTALAAAGRQTAVELYDIGRMAADIETCLQEVVNGS